MAIVLPPSRKLIFRSSMPIIDRNNHYTRNLLWAVLPDLYRNELISNHRPILTGTATFNGRTQDGLGAESHSITADCIAWPQGGAFTTAIGTAFTFMIRYSHDNHGTYNHIMAIPYRSAGWTNPYATLSIYCYGSGGTKPAILHATSGSAYRNNNFTGNRIFVDGTLHTYTFTYTAGVQKVYVDGVWQETVTDSTGPFNIDNTNQQPLCVLNHSSSSPGEGTDGRVVFAYFWNKCFTDNEVIRLYQDPYQIFVRPISIFQNTVGAPPVTVIPVLMDTYRRRRELCG